TAQVMRQERYGWLGLVHGNEIQCRAHGYTIGVLEVSAAQSREELLQLDLDIPLVHIGQRGRAQCSITFGILTMAAGAMTLIKRNPVVVGWPVPDFRIECILRMELGIGGVFNFVVIEVQA